MEEREEFTGTEERNESASQDNTSEATTQEASSEFEAETVVAEDSTTETPEKEAMDTVADADIHGIIEALIFSANDPVDAAKLCKVYEEVSGGMTISSGEVYDVIKALNEQYASSGRAFHIFEWAGGFRLATQPEYAPYVKSLHEIDSKRKLSRSLIETLAIVAYKQPVTKPEIDFVRGVDSDYAVRRLMELDLVDVIGRSESVGKPLLYGTTRDFLEKFGLSDIDSLPSLREIEDLLDDPAFNRERAELLMSKGLSLHATEESSLESEEMGEDGDEPQNSDDTGLQLEQAKDTITVDPPSRPEPATEVGVAETNINGASRNDGSE